MAYELDSRDRKILFELDFNARQSVSSIARKIGLSKEATNYRIKNLEKKGIIEKYYCVLNVPRLGYLYTRLLIKFQNLSPQKEKEILKDMVNKPNIGWIVSTTGEYDLLLSIWTKTIYDFEKILGDINSKYGSNIEQRFISMVTKIYHYKHKFLYEEKDHTQASFTSGTFNIDQTDKTILKLLSQNCRMPLIKMSKALDLDPTSVTYRIKKLEDNNIIQAYRAKLNPSLLGYQHIKVFFYLNNFDNKKFNQLLTYLRFHPNVVYCVQAICCPAFDIEMHVKDLKQFENIMSDIRTKFSGVIKNYKVLQYFKEHYINYFPV